MAVLLTSLAACGRHDAEQLLLDQFFSVSRLRDKTALQTFATVSFEPHTDGTITSFTIARVSPEEYKPLAKLGSEIQIAELSVDDPRHPVDVKSYDGQMVSKEVTIQAPVRLPDGQTAQKTLHIILQRAILNGDREVVGRWIVTGLVARNAAQD